MLCGRRSEVKTMFRMCGMFFTYRVRVVWRGFVAATVTWERENEQVVCVMGWSEVGQL